MIDKGRVKGLRALRIPEGKKMKKEREREGETERGGEKEGDAKDDGIL